MTALEQAIRDTVEKGGYDLHKGLGLPKGIQVSPNLFAGAMAMPERVLLDEHLASGKGVESFFESIIKV